MGVAANESFAGNVGVWRNVLERGRFSNGHNWFTPLPVFWSACCGLFQNARLLLNSFFIVRNNDQLKNCHQWLNKLKSQYDWIKVVVQTEKRSTSKNALSHAWYKEIAEQTGWTEKEAKNYCKREFGVPILLAENKEWAWGYEKALEAFLVIGEAKGKTKYEIEMYMMDLMAVTSKMTEMQMKDYLQRMSIHFAEQNIFLTSERDF